MPRKAKEKEEEKISTAKPKKATTVKKSITKKETSSAKQTKEKKVTKKASTSKKTVSKKETASKKSVTKSTPTKSKKVASKTAEKNKTADKKPTKKVASKSTAKDLETKTKKTAKKVATKTKKKTTKKTATTKKKKIDIVEYYDLPYRYNQTVVKLLTQTPNTLFVYWDISDKDKDNYINKYGEYFFNNTKPVLVIHNITKKYSFEIDINDFANSWYLHVQDSNCEYQVELGRRPINEYVQIENNYLYVTTSNNMMNQNDHILLDKLSHFVYFRNVKTNQLIKKNISLSLLKKLGKIDSIKEFYKKLYPDEEINFDKLDLKNPSSSSVFK